MTIDDKQLSHLLALARLEVRADERPALTRDLNDILGYFERIRNLDTDAVKPLIRPIAPGNVFREDEQRPSLPRERTLDLSVASDDGFIKVPRTVDEGN